MTVIRGIQNLPVTSVVQNYRSCVELTDTYGNKMLWIEGLWCERAWVGWRWHMSRVPVVLEATKTHASVACELFPHDCSPRSSLWLGGSRWCAGQQSPYDLVSETDTVGPEGDLAEFPTRCHEGTCTWNIGHSIPRLMLMIVQMKESGIYLWTLIWWSGDVQCSTKQQDQHMSCPPKQSSHRKTASPRNMGSTVRQPMHSAKYGSPRPSSWLHSSRYSSRKGIHVFNGSSWGVWVSNVALGYLNNIPNSGTA
jgi:hypothetical protein